MTSPAGVDEVVRRLRGKGRDVARELGDTGITSYGFEPDADSREAADLLTAHAAENTRLRKYVDDVCEKRNSFLAENCNTYRMAKEAAEAEAQKLRAERDAAIAALNERASDV